MKRIAMILVLAACGSSSPAPVDGGIDLGSDTAAVDVVAQDGEVTEGGAPSSDANCRPVSAYCHSDSECCGAPCTNTIGQVWQCCAPSGAACSSDGDCCPLWPGAQTCTGGICVPKQ